MRELRANAPLRHENSRSVVEAAIDLSRSTKDGTWERVVRKSPRQDSYSVGYRGCTEDRPDTLHRE